MTVYRADPPESLRIVTLDSLTAIYHRRSGQTHVVAEPVPDILAALHQGDAALATLAARLGIEDVATLAVRLRELTETGLVATA